MDGVPLSIGDNVSQQEVSAQRVQYKNTVDNVSFDGFDFVVNDDDMFGSQPDGGSFLRVYLGGVDIASAAIAQ